MLGSSLEVAYQFKGRRLQGCQCFVLDNALRLIAVYEFELDLAGSRIEINVKNTVGNFGASLSIRVLGLAELEYLVGPLKLQEHFLQIAHRIHYGPLPLGDA